MTAEFDLDAWLEGIGLEKYSQLFAENQIRGDVLPDLTAEDLRELGIPLGDRKRLLAAIAQFEAPVEPEAHPAAPAAPEAPAANEAPAADEADEAEIERRQITVLFCDLAGFTEFATRLDPEDLETLVGHFLDRCAATVEEWGGHVASYMGDGLLAVFGWPQASEHAADEAVRTGLSIMRAVETLEAPAGARIRARVGVATGLVLVGRSVGEGAARSEAVFGATPNLAARLEALASPGEVLLAEATRLLLSDTFALSDMGSHRLKGFADPVQVWRADGVAEAPSRARARGRVEALPFVGRGSQLAHLEAAWSEVAGGGGARAVLVSAEAGMGKTRLVEHFCDGLPEDGHHRIALQCWPYKAAGTLYPVVDFLKAATGCSGAEAAAARRRKFAAYAERLRLPPDLFFEHLGDLLDLGEPIAGQSAQARRDDWLVSLERVFARLATDAPLLLLIEDGHWIDPVSDELLHHLTVQLTAQPVMILATGRPDYAPAWLESPCASRIDIPRLDEAAAETLVARIAAERSLPPALFARIIETTDGVPLFIEELTRSVLDLGTGAAGDGAISIPATLQDVLAARLDSTAEAKRTAQVAACIGRAFSPALLRRVAGLAEAELARHIDRLLQANLVSAETAAGEAHYVFRHALIQEAAYQSQTKARRREVHRAIAKALEDATRAGAEVDPATLANHFTAAGALETAIDYWRAAGERANARSAEREAIEHYRRAIELIGRVPATPENEARELTVQLAIGPALAATDGYGSPDVRAAFDRAEALVERRGTPEQMFAVRRGQWMYLQMSADYAGAEATARSMHRLAERAGRADLTLEADRALGATAFVTGKLAEARRHLEAGIPRYVEDASEAHTLSYGDDPGLACLSYLGRALWFLGYPDQSLERCLTALEVAHRINHPFSLARTYVFVAHSHQLRGEIEPLIEVARRSAEISDEHGFPFFGGVSRMLWGWALSRSDRQDEAEARLAEGYAQYQSSQSRMSKPWFLMLIADAERRAGQLETAARRIDEALEIRATTGEHVVAPECLRVRGEVRLDRGDAEGARADFVAAMEVARGQAARSCELRAALNLARLDPAAHGPLAALLDGFTEGGDTADLRAARAALAAGD